MSENIVEWRSITKLDLPPERILTEKAIECATTPADRLAHFLSGLEQPGARCQIGTPNALGCEDTSSFNAAELHAAIASALREAEVAMLANFSDIQSITLGDKLVGKITEQEACGLVNAVLASMRASAIRNRGEAFDGFRQAAQQQERTVSASPLQSGDGGEAEAPMHLVPLLDQFAQIAARLEKVGPTWRAPNDDEAKLRWYGEIIAQDYERAASAIRTLIAAYTQGQIEERGTRDEVSASADQLPETIIRNRGEAE